jgi:hypothetical protein
MVRYGEHTNSRFFSIKHASDLLYIWSCPRENSRGKILIFLLYKFRCPLENTYPIIFQPSLTHKEDACESLGDLDDFKIRSIHCTLKSTLLENTF